MAMYLYFVVASLAATHGAESCSVEDVTAFWAKLGMTEESARASKSLSLSGMSAEEVLVFAHIISMGTLSSLEVLKVEKAALDADNTAILATALGTPGRLGGLRELTFTWCNIDDDGVVKLATEIGRGNTPGLRVLRLMSNPFGQNAEGVAALAAGLSSGAPNLDTLSLPSNLITSAGAQALAAAITDGSFGLIKSLYLHKNHIGDSGLIALSDAIAAGGLAKLDMWYLGDNKYGDTAFMAFGAALENALALPSLTTLNLSSLKLTDAGWVAFTTAIGNGALASLKSIRIMDKQPHVQLKAACAARGIVLDLQ